MVLLNCYLLNSCLNAVYMKQYINDLSTLLTLGSLAIGDLCIYSWGEIVEHVPPPCICVMHWRGTIIQGEDIFAFLCILLLMLIFLLDIVPKEGRIQEGGKRCTIRKA